MRIKKGTSESGKVSATSAPDNTNIKAEIVQKMVKTIEEKSLTQRVVGELLGVSQPRVSMMLRGQVNACTEEQLADYLSILSGGSKTAPSKATSKAPRSPKSATKAKATKSIKPSGEKAVPTKAAVVKKIAKEMARCGLSQRAAAELLGLTQSKISLVLRGKTNAGTVEELEGYLNILSQQTGAAKGTPRSGKAKVASKKDRSVAVPNSSDELSSKTDLVEKIAKAIADKKLSQRLVGELLGFSQPMVSLMLRGRVNAYSIDQLSGYLEILSGQAPVAGGAPAQGTNKKQSKASPSAAPETSLDESLASVPAAVANADGSSAEMMEEIALLRQQLVLASGASLGESPYRSDLVIQAEVEQLREENAALKKKAQLFDRVAALLQQA